MNHYPVDMGTVRKKTRRSKEEEAESAREMGWFAYNVFEIVTMNRIIHQEVWNPPRFDKALKLMQQGTRLDPISVSKEPDGRFSISNGIHRFNASQAMGYTHIPVIYSVVVETPDAQVVEPVKPRLERGTWVRLRKPRGVSEWAVIDEYLSQRFWQGAQRYMYSLVGIEKGRAEFIGDHLDLDFDIATENPPASLVQILQTDWPTDDVPTFRVRRSASTVADRFLLS